MLRYVKTMKSIYEKRSGEELREELWKYTTNSVIQSCIAEWKGACNLCACWEIWVAPVDALRHKILKLHSTNHKQSIRRWWFHRRSKSTYRHLLPVVVVFDNFLCERNDRQNWMAVWSKQISKFFLEIMNFSGYSEISDWAIFGFFLGSFFHNLLKFSRMRSTETQRP